MIDPAPSPSPGLLRRLGWSNSRRSWLERLAAACVLIVVGAFAWFHAALPPGLLAAVGLLAGLALAVLFRRGWLRLFGPVLFYDLVRSARRRRVHVLRVVYAGGLLTILSFIAFAASEGHSRYYRPTVHDQAEIANMFFGLFMGTQFAAVVLLTPGYVAGAVAEEKERRTLEFVLATDLRNREVVLSKLAARTLNLTLFLLTGLPVFSALQFLGGIQPEWLLAGFAATGLTLVSLAAASILASVLCRRARDAILGTYVLAAGYFAVSLAAFGLIRSPWLAWVATAGVTLAGTTVTPTDAVDALGAGNPVVALIHVFGGGLTAGGLAAVLRDYALFHGLTALACTVLAVRLLRPVALRQLFGGPGRGRSAGSRPPVGREPMVWKEVVFESYRQRRLLARLAVVALVLLSFLPAGLMTVELLDQLVGGRAQSNPWSNMRMAAQDRTGFLLRIYAEEMNAWVRGVGATVAALALVGVAVRAAASVGGERDRQTLDSLLTSPLTTRELLLGKWLGALLGWRAAWLWLLLIWAAGLAAEGLHPLAVALLVPAWFAYAALMASIGLWFSVVCRTAQRATVATLGTVFVVLGGHWLLLLFGCVIPLSLSGGSPGRLEGLYAFWTGLTPPAVLGVVSFRSLEPYPHSGYRDEFLPFFTLGSICGVGGAILAAGLIWWAALQRFARTTGRGRRTAGQPPSALR
jgi:ABC-type transport system involved in multi-copper enzyme maturation permease subunit